MDHKIVPSIILLQVFFSSSVITTDFQRPGIAASSTSTDASSHACALHQTQSQLCLRAATRDAPPAVHGHATLSTEGLCVDPMKLKRRLNDLFANLPSEIIIEILSRLPVRSIVSCKLVRKSWLALIDTPHFLNSHLSKPVTALVLFHSNSHTIYEFEDELDIENYKLPFTRVTHFCFPKKCEYPSVSANGLLLHYNWNPLTLYISNPITREYFQLPELHCASPKLEALGFGASKVLGQHKVVTIFQNEVPKLDSKCYVYTIGTGVWRKMEPPTGYGYYYDIGEFVNANLHWLVSDLEASHAWISCFHLENETFSTFSFPPMPGRNVCHARFCAVGDTLCLLNTNTSDTTAIWLMKQYGDDQSWAKQFVIISHLELGTVWPIRVFKNGEVFMGWSNEDEGSIFYFNKNSNYFNKDRTVRFIDDKFDSRTDCILFLHTPSFLSLKCYVRENVMLF